MTESCIASSNKTIVGKDCESKRFINRINNVNASLCEIRLRIELAKFKLARCCSISESSSESSSSSSSSECFKAERCIPDFVYIVTVNDLNQDMYDLLELLEQEACDLLRKLIDFEELNVCESSSSSETSSESYSSSSSSSEYVSYSYSDSESSSDSSYESSSVSGSSSNSSSLSSFDSSSNSSSNSSSLSSSESSSLSSSEPVESCAARIMFVNACSSFIGGSGGMILILQLVENTDPDPELYGSCYYQADYIKNERGTIIRLNDCTIRFVLATNTWEFWAPSKGVLATKSTGSYGSPDGEYTMTVPAYPLCDGTKANVYLY